MFGFIKWHIFKELMIYTSGFASVQGSTAKFPCKNIFELPMLLSGTAVCLLCKLRPATERVWTGKRVKSIAMLGCSRTRLQMTECHLHTECQLLLGPVFDSTEPLLVVVCLAIT